MTDMTERGDLVSIQSDNNMREMLEHLSSTYLLDCMDAEIDMFFTHPFNCYRHPANIVSTMEENYKEIITEYPFKELEINGQRTETYYYILEQLASRYGFQINKSENVINNYTLALWLYQILICDINSHILTFIGDYIIDNVADLYDACDLKSLSKSVDPSYVNLYDDPKIAIICAHLYKVIKYMSEFDITFSDFIERLPIESSVKSMVINNVSETNSFYKNVICGRFFNCYYAATLVTELRIYINNKKQLKHFSISDYLNK